MSVFDVLTLYVRVLSVLLTSEYRDFTIVQPTLFSPSMTLDVETVQSNYLAALLITSARGWHWISRPCCPYRWSCKLF